MKTVFDRLLNPRSRLERLRRESASAPRGNGDEAGSARPHPGRLRPRDIWLNGPLMLGGLIVLLLFLVVLFGPIWAPENPYLAGQHVKDLREGSLRFVSPPLPPSPRFPLGTDQWGNDLLSLLLHGARNTLVACAFVTMVRVTLGLVLGALAGWKEGNWIDRTVMGASSVIASVPMLISSMMLILALDIRKGLPVFIIALSAVGWSEVAQYIRSEFMVLRRMPYIEGARSVGARGLAVAVRHILPNVLPQLLIITSLEMGAVMMLLGELGFIGVFIGGGSRITLDLNATDTWQVHTLAEIPEWGAMLATGFRFLRTKPFVALPPALAFFVSVLGFNTLGEGLRRLIERSPISTAFLLRKRIVMVLALLSAATVFIINQASPTPWFVKAAQAFNAASAYEHLERLATMRGRGAGQAEGLRAAGYVAERFEQYGLSPGWKSGSFLREERAIVALPFEQPRLTVLAEDGSVLEELQHQVDFGYLIQGHAGAGECRAPLTFIGFRPGASAPPREAYIGLDLRGRVVMVLGENAPSDFPVEAQIRGALGILVVVGSRASGEVHSQVHLADPGYDRLRSPTLPIFKISREAAAAILEREGASLPELYSEQDALAADSPGWFRRDLSLGVAMTLKLSAPEEVGIPAVLGYLPGSDLSLADQLVVVIARYDGLGVDPDGTLFPGANHNASGTAVLIELARLWRDQNLGPRRSVLLVAWGGGDPNRSAAEDFLAAKLDLSHLPTRNPFADLRPHLILEMDYAGAGEQLSLLEASSGAQVGRLLRETAAEVGSALAEASSPPTSAGAGNVPRALLGWTQSGYQAKEDTLKHIELDKLQTIGEVLALAVTKIVRQTTY